jgi:hypothetical protein
MMFDATDVPDILADPRALIITGARFLNYCNDDVWKPFGGRAGAMRREA